MSPLNPLAPPFTPRSHPPPPISLPSHHTNHNINIGHLNVRSLRHKLHEIQSLISDHSLDVLAITETWLDNTVADSELAIDGYTLFRRDQECPRSCPCLSGLSVPCRKAGGVCVYTSTRLGFTRHLLKSSNNFEMLWLTSRRRRNAAPFHLGCLYRPPNSPASFWTSLAQELTELQGNSLTIVMNFYGQTEHN